MLSNTTSLAPKIDAIRHSVLQTNVDLASFTETWLSVTSIEVLWVKVRPYRLPRGVSCIIIGTIYHPPSANYRNIIDFLTEQLSLVESVYHNCAWSYFTWGFSNLNCRRLQNHFSLKQLVTRGRTTLTNLDKFYQPPQKLPPFGLSDHFTIFYDS